MRCSWVLLEGFKAEQMTLRLRVRMNFQKMRMKVKERVSYIVIQVRKLASSLRAVLPGGGGHTTHTMGDGKKIFS